MHDLASNAEMNLPDRRLVLTVAQAASVLKLHPEVVRRRCKATCRDHCLECFKVRDSRMRYPRWTVQVPESAIKESSYVAVGGFDGSIGLDFLLLEKIEDYGGEMFDANSDYGSPIGSEETLARLKGEICTIIKAMLS